MIICDDAIICGNVMKYDMKWKFINTMKVNSNFNL